MSAVIKLRAPALFWLPVIISVAISCTLVAQREDFHHPVVVPVTSCVDPAYHFTISRFTGVVFDEKGKRVPQVSADVYRFRKEPGGRGPFEPSPEVFTTFVTDAEGSFSLPKLHKGMYLVILHPPRLYMAYRVVVKLEKHGASEGLIARLGLLGGCQGSWELAERVD